MDFKDTSMLGVKHFLDVRKKFQFPLFNLSFPCVDNHGNIFLNVTLIISLISLFFSRWVKNCKWLSSSYFQVVVPGFGMIPVREEIEGCSGLLCPAMRLFSSPQTYILSPRSSSKGTNQVVILLSILPFIVLGVLMSDPLTFELGNLA